MSDLTPEDREALGRAVLSARWPDGGYEGLPTKRTAPMVTDALTPVVARIRDEAVRALAGQVEAVLAGWDRGLDVDEAHEMDPSRRLLRDLRAVLPDRADRKDGGEQ